LGNTGAEQGHFDCYEEVKTMKEQENTPKCDGRAGCECPECADWDKDAARTDYGWQKWQRLSEKSSAHA